MTQVNQLVNNFETMSLSILFSLSRSKVAELYIEEDLQKTKRKLFSASAGVDLSLTTSLYRLYGRDAWNVQKYLIVCLKMTQVKPGIRLYDILMRDFLQRVYGKTVMNLEEVWSGLCWECSEAKHKLELKSCSVCKFAKYCGAECQRKEWKRHKVLHAYMDSIFEKGSTLGDAS